MKTIAFIFFGLAIFTVSEAQSIIGSWQLVKETTCLEESLTADNDTVESDLLAEMKSMSSPYAQVVTFKERMVGQEATRILTRKKSDNKKSFLYKFDGEMLYILDKKSQTITENFMVDKFSTDSLIISSASRPCETKVFARIK